MTLCFLTLCALVGSEKVFSGEPYLTVTGGKKLPKDLK